MEPKHNFEQYKKDQAELEKIPTIKPEFYFIINDISKKIFENQILSEKEVDNLEMVYEMTQALEKELVTFLDKYRSKEIINKLEFLISLDYFLTANQNGPDASVIKRILIMKNVSIEKFKSISEEVSIPKNIREMLVLVYRKILESKI